MIKKALYTFFSALVIIVLVFSIVLSSCKKMMSPPDVQTVEKKFFQCYDDIQVIVDYLAESQYGSIYICNDSGMMSVGTYKMEITDPSVLAALKRLVDENYSVINKYGNTIHFQQWTRFTDAGCGIAYSINHKDAPEIEYLIELTPLSTEGWYYYVDDYNEWRD